MDAEAARFEQRAGPREGGGQQEIVADQLPFIYLVNKNALSAVSPDLQGVNPVILRPQTYWNADQLSLKPELARNRR